MCNQSHFDYIRWKKYQIYANFVIMVYGQIIKLSRCSNIFETKANTNSSPTLQHGQFGLEKDKSHLSSQ